MKIKSYFLNRESRYSHEIDDLSSSSTRLAFTEAYRSRNRVRFLALALIIVGALFSWRLASLQVFQGDIFLRKSEGNRLLITKVSALRGKILDRMGKPIADNAPSYALYFTGSSSTTLKEITDVLGIDYESARAELARGYGTGGEIVSGITPDKAIPLALKIARYPSELTLVPQPRRAYLYPDIGLSALIGYLGKPSPNDSDAKLAVRYDFDDDIGKSGVEHFYNTLLLGTNGRLETEVDATGRQKLEKRVVPSQSGADIVLTIDLEMQKELYKALSNEIVTSGKRSGVAIVEDPTNGEILAMAQYPNFDSNVFLDNSRSEEVKKILTDSDHPLFLRAVQGQYPSGSVIKPIVASAALEENVITRAFTVMSVGGIHIGASFFPDWKAGGHGKTNVIKALAESVNTFFYIIGGGYEEVHGLGPEKIKNYASRFGWGRALGVDLDNEATGFLPTPEWKILAKHERWYLGDTYHLAIGQGDVLVTPLQVESMMATIANGGTLFRPHILRYSLGVQGALERITEPSVLYRDIISSSTLGIVREGLRQAVVSGSARRLQSVPVEVAGKTGTAQLAIGDPHAWFSGFAPYNNPQIAITVLIENGVEGSTTAVPVAQQFLQWYFTSYARP